MKEELKNIISQKKRKIHHYTNLVSNNVNRGIGSNILPVVPKFIKVYGSLRSGTNYLSKLLELNFKANVYNHSEHSWKHGPCKYEKYLSYVFISKDPYSWLLSFKHWEDIHARNTIDDNGEFMRSTVTHRELREAWNASNPVEVWNVSMKSWLSVSERSNCVFIRYEDLLADYMKVLQVIKEKLDLKLAVNEFKNLSKRADTWKTKRPRKTLNKEYYLEKQYMKEYSNLDLRYLKRMLDHEVMEKLSYKIYDERN